MAYLRAVTTISQGARQTVGDDLEIEKGVREPQQISIRAMLEPGECGLRSKRGIGIGNALDERLRSRARRSKRRSRIILDFDSTDFVTYGDRQFALFHGHYGNYIHYPLLVFDQDGWPVAGHASSR